MVRLLCMPKHIEQQFLKKVRQLDVIDRQIIAAVLELPQYDSVRVALCTDGGSALDTTSVANGLKNLYATLGIGAHVSAQPFSFLSNDIAAQRAILHAADIFWFAGVHFVPARLRQVLARRPDETDVNDLAAQVRRRVQYDHMPYVGVCGGASMASSPETCVYECGLDLMQGREIYYAYQTEVNMSGRIGEEVLDERLRCIANKLAFTDKCAFAVVLSSARIDAVCFPAVKNAGRLREFAKHHSGLLRSIVHQIASEWKEFRSPTQGHWFFNLRGYYAFKHRAALRELHLM